MSLKMTVILTAVVTFMVMKLATLFSCTSSPAEEVAESQRSRAARQKYVQKMFDENVYEVTALDGGYRCLYLDVYRGSGISCERIVQRCAAPCSEAQ